jgi:hypothetical protein
MNKKHKQSSKLIEYRLNDLLWNRLGNQIKSHLWAHLEPQLRHQLWIELRHNLSEKT